MTSRTAGSDQVERQILKLLGETCLRMTPIDLVGTLAKEFPELDRRSLNQTIRKMVTQGVLSYSHHYNSTHIELANSGRIPISNRLSLNTTSGIDEKSGSHFSFRVQSGSAFGRGDHPTTILALKAIDWISMETDPNPAQDDIRVLDIGTGTGVLALAAALLGLGSAIAIDIDRLACREALENVRINNLVGRVHIVAGGLEALGPSPFDTILANLRPPTLAHLIPGLAERTKDRGHWVLSGFRPDEAAGVLALLPGDFERVWQEKNRNWSALVVRNVQGRF